MTFYEKADLQRQKALTEAFIAVINADHDDQIIVSREHGCAIRNEILRLRKKAKED